MRIEWPSFENGFSICQMFVATLDDTNREQRVTLVKLPGCFCIAFLGCRAGELRSRVPSRAVMVNAGDAVLNAVLPVVKMQPLLSFLSVVIHVMDSFQTNFLSH